MILNHHHVPQWLSIFCPTAIFISILLNLLNLLQAIDTILDFCLVLIDFVFYYLIGKCSNHFFYILLLIYINIDQNGAENRTMYHDIRYLPSAWHHFINLQSFMITQHFWSLSKSNERFYQTYRWIQVYHAKDIWTWINFDHVKNEIASDIISLLSTYNIPWLLFLY